jgi:lipopolysaccharide export system protein LptC
MTLATRARYWLPLLPLLGLLGVTYWLNQQVQPETDQLQTEKRHDPDAVMENFSSISLNEQGKPRYMMAAKKLQHYPDDDSTELEAPNFTLLTDGQAAIHITARQGKVSSKGDEVFFHKDVEVLREASVKQDMLTLRTEYLHLVPERDWADTDRDVAIVEAENTVFAKGMEIDNKVRTLKLLSQVRVNYVSTKK